MYGDLTVMGKVIGGGLPAAAVGGRAELMRMLAPAGEVYQAGTLSGNPLAVAAGIATLELLDELAYVRLSALTTRLADGLRAAAEEASVPVQVQSATGLLSVFFSERPVTSTSRTPRAATWRPTRAGAGSCSRAAYTRRRRSSRPGSPRWPTPRSTSSAPSRPPRRRSRACPAGALVSVASDAPAGSLLRLRTLLAERGGLLAGLLSEDPLDGASRAGPARRPRWRPADRGRGPPRGVRAAAGGDLRGLPGALRRAAPAACPGNGPRPAGRRSAVRDRARPAGGDRRHRGRQRARRHDHPERAGAGGRRGRAVRGGMAGRRARRGLGLRRPSTGARRSWRGRARRRHSLQCAQVRRVQRPRVELASIFCAPVPPDRHARQKSKYTSDRGIPGAYEGETVTRRRFMVVGANTAGGSPPPPSYCRPWVSGWGRSSRANRRAGKRSGPSTSSTSSTTSRSC